jgi:xylan 1,4-beta-xylosidase
VRQQDISHPIPKPKRGLRRTHGVAFSDDFSTSALGWRWTSFNPGQDYANRIQTGSEGLTLLAQGANPGASSPLVLNVGDRKYEFRVRLDLRDDAQAGLLLFYNSTFFCGIGADERRIHLYKMGVEPFWEPVRPGVGAHLWLRVINNENVASFYSSADGENWMLQASFEVAGYNHNVADGFLSLRPAIFVSGRGSAVFRAAAYSALV